MTSSEAQRTFFDDLQQLATTIDASTDGQASIVESDATTVKVSLRPNSGHYVHAQFLMTVKRTSSHILFISPSMCLEVH